MDERVIHNFVETSAARYPDKVAIVHENNRITYRQVNDASNRLAHFFIDRGVCAGERIVLLLENSCEYAIAYYGILKAGAVAVPLSYDLKPEGLNPLLIELEPAVIVSSTRFERLLKASDLSVSNLKTLVIHNPKQDWSDTSITVFQFHRVTSRSQDKTKHCGADLKSNAVSVASSDLANIIYTSGSTGKPKGVMLTHGNIVPNVNSICDCLELTADDIQMVVLPFFYVMGQSLLNTIVAVGGTLVINNKFAFPASVVNQMIDEKVTIFSGVPSTYAYLLHRSPLKSSAANLKHLRIVTQAGGHMAESVKKALRKALPDHTRICIMYGATEASARLACLAPEWFEKKMGSIGQAISGVKLKIFDDDGEELPPGEKGELVASGPNIMRGYWQDEKATTSVLDKNGYHTGDIGWQDDDGFFFIEGRNDNLLKVGGHRINPQEVEDALLSTKLIIETAVIGIPDKLLETRLAALIVPLNFEDPDIDYIRTALAALLPKYKLPSDIKPVRLLPKSSNGKVDYSACLKIADVNH